MSDRIFFTLITGASQGIGRALSFEYAKRGNNLFLIALPQPVLEDLKKEILEKFDIEVVTLGLNLTDENAPETIFEYAKNKGIQVNRVINNAGMGISGLFENSKMEMNKYLMQLNNQSMVGIIHFFLKSLKENAPSQIINMSSMEATLPLPYKAVYTATKNFIFSFSLALSEEVKEDGIRVSVVCPGSVVTNEDGMKRIKAMGWKAKLLVKMPDEVASIIASEADREKRVIIPGFVPKFVIIVMHILPLGLKMKILEKLFRPYKSHIPLDITKKI